MPLTLTTTDRPPARKPEPPVRHEPVRLSALAEVAAWLRKTAGLCLIAIHDPDHVEALTAFLAKTASTFSRPPTLLAADVAIARLLTARGVSCVTPEQYLESGDYDGINVEAMRLGACWPRVFSADGTVDVTLYKGISVAGLVQWEMTYALAEAMRCVVEMQRVLERLKPSLLVFLESPLPARHGLLRQAGEDGHRFAAQTLSGDRTIVVRMPPSSALSAVGDRSRRSRWQGWLNGRLGRAASAVSSRWAARARRPILVSGVRHLGDEVVRRLARAHRHPVIIADEGWSPRLWWRITARCGARWEAPLASVPLPPKVFEEIEAALGRITACLRASGHRLHTLTFRGVDLAAFLDERLAYLQTVRWRELMVDIERWLRLLRARRVGLVVVNEDLTPRPKTLVRAAQHLRIPTVVVQHGIYIHPTDIVLNADYFAVWGDATRRLMQEGGYAADRLIATGASRFDRLALLRTRRAPIRRRVLSRLGLDPERSVVMLTAQGVRPATYFPGCHVSPREHYELCRMAVHAVERLPQMQLILKFHTMEPNAQWIEESLRREGGCDRVRFLQHADTYRLLCATDCVLTGWSTTGLEAMALDIPVIVIRVRPQPYRMPYVQSGAALEATSVDELEQALQAVLEPSSGVRDTLKPRMAQLFRDWCGAPIGEASRTLASRLMALHPDAQRPSASTVMSEV